MSATKIAHQKPTLASAMRSIRLERKWSLSEASAATGLSVSTLSKIENGQRSLTYDKLVHLAEALDVDIARLFSDQVGGPKQDVHAGRRSVHRGSEGFILEAGVYTYTFLAEELTRKRFSPVLMQLHARSISEFDELLRHQGEEFAFVLQGEVDVHNEAYAPLRLSAGQSVYFDSNVGHAYINATEEPATILTIASEPTAPDGSLAVPSVQPRRPAPGAGETVVAISPPRQTRPRAKKTAKTEPKGS